MIHQTQIISPNGLGWYHHHPDAPRGGPGIISFRPHRNLPRTYASTYRTFQQTLVLQKLQSNLGQRRLRQTQTKTNSSFQGAQRAFVKGNQSSLGSPLIRFNHQLCLSDPWFLSPWKTKGAKRILVCFGDWFQSRPWGHLPRCFRQQL